MTESDMWKTRVLWMRERFVDLFFSKICVFCGRILPIEKNAAEIFFAKEMNLCRKCLAILPVRLPIDQILTDSIEVEHDETEKSFHMYMPFFYEKQMISILRLLKFNEGLFLSKPLGFFMAMIAKDHGLVPDIILPAPLSPKRQRERGYNQAFLLAKELSGWLDKPVVEDCLFRVKDTKRQSEIEDSAMRRLNVDDAFAVSDLWDVEGLRILIVDDIFTTGATMISAARALLKAGALNVVGIAAASGRTGRETGIMSEPDASEAHVFEPS